MTIVLRRKGCLFSVLFSEWFRTITSKREKDKNYYGVRLKENAKTTGRERETVYDMRLKTKD
ncbi:MAG: hypothetical protein WAO75_04010 [Atribacterales bacterium]|jgi:hypothetical protein